MFANPLFMSAKRSLSYSDTRSNVNLFEDAGSPTAPQEVYVYVTSTAIITGFDTGEWPEGSLIRLFNQGYILGQGGAGGEAGQRLVPFTFQGADGQDGNPAITLGVDIVIYMRTGYIWGGGGGGGGGSAVAVGGTFYNGGGGGGGVSGGAGGAGSYINPELYKGEAATVGITATPGAGGVSPGSNGGAGGSWGNSGNPGEVVSGVPAGAGGNGGPSISLNGFSWSLAYDNFADLIFNGRIKGVII